MKYRIKEILNQKGMSSAELATRIGCSAVTLSNIVTGQNQPSVSRLEEIADALGVTVPDLMVLPERYVVKACCPNCQRPLKVTVEIDESAQ